MHAKNAEDPAGAPLAAEDAWRTFEGWRAEGRQIGLIFLGGWGSLTTSGTVAKARMGRLQFNSETAEISFRLKGANFTYGPVQMYPNWPYPPQVDVIAVQAWYENGDWLAMAERPRPPAVA
jgi:hypothetical protein